MGSLSILGLPQISPGVVLEYAIVKRFLQLKTGLGGSSIAGSTVFKPLCRVGFLAFRFLSSVFWWCWLVLSPFCWWKANFSPQSPCYSSSSSQASSSRALGA